MKVQGKKQERAIAEAVTVGKTRSQHRKNTASILLTICLIFGLTVGIAAPSALAAPFHAEPLHREIAATSPVASLFADLSESFSRFSDSDIKAISKLRKEAFAATQSGNFTEAERQWSALIERLPQEAAVWSNRGNVRVRQNDLDGALADYSQAIELAPQEPDPYLNRGAVWEATGQWEKAIADYNAVLQIDPDDPAAYNNRGNAEGGAGEWDLAIADYQAAITLQPSFSLAYGNYALALYQTGNVKQALQIMKSLVRKYPSFADMRAALTAALWDRGQAGEAESNWVAVVGLDSRYKDINWVKNVRRWPPVMVEALESFLTL